MLAPTAPDASTVVVQLTDPVAYQINFFAPLGGFTVTTTITPREADDTLDLRQQMVGTGPFLLSRHEPSVTFEHKRNPEYWDPDAALVDEIQLPIMVWPL